MSDGKPRRFVVLLDTGFRWFIYALMVGFVLLIVGGVVMILISAYWQGF